MRYEHQAPGQPSQLSPGAQPSALAPRPRSGAPFLRRLLPLLLGGYALSACSLIMDPENCESDRDCNGGVCTSGICVGGHTGGEDASTADGALDRGLDETDAVPPDLGPQIDQGPAEDLGPQDAAQPQRPVCTIVSPAEGERVVNTEQIAVTVHIEDTDTAPEDLQVTLGPPRDPISLDLDAQGQATALLDLTAGANRFTLRAVDPDGLECTLTLTIEADFSPPTLEITRPSGTQTAVRTTPYVIEGNATDDQPVRALEVQLHGEIVALDPTWQGALFSLPIELEKGPNPLTLTAIDRAGNRSPGRSVSIFYDPDPPEVTIESPVEGERTEAQQLTLVAQVADGQESAEALNVRLTVSGPLPSQQTAYENLAVGASGRVEQPNVGLFVGANRLELCARDRAGNNTCATVNVTREDQAPCVNLEAPAPNSYTADEALVVRGTVCPVVETLTLQLNGGSDEAIPLEEGQFEHTLTLPSDGSHTLNLVARAQDGRTAQAQRQVTLDRTPPTLRIDSPAALSCLHPVRDEICVTASDPDSGIARAQLGELVVSQPQISFCLPLIDLEDGAQQNLTVEVTNRAGLTAQAQLMVNIDSSVPQITLNEELSWQQPNAQGQITLSGQVQTTICKLEGDRVLISTPSLNQNASVSAQGHFTHNLTLLDGAHTVSVKAQNLAGSTSTETTTLRVDGTAPTFDELHPSESLVRGQSVLVEALLSDGQGSGVLEAHINGEVVPLQGAWIRREITLVDGLNEVLLEATDRAGNTAQHTLSLYRDVEPPQLTLEWPEAGGAVALPTLVMGTVTDGEWGSGVEQVLVNGVEAQIDEEGQWIAYAVPIDPQDPKITVSALDREGNESPPVERAVAVHNYAPLDPQVYGLEGSAQIAHILTADLNGDGHLDVIALSNQAQGQSAIYLQTPEGRFEMLDAAEANLPAGAVRGAHLADFNRDGRVDLLVWGSDFMKVLPGTGLGGFGAQRLDTLVNNLNPTQLLVGDLDRDGRLDLLLRTGNEVRPYLGLGDGNFVRGALEELGLDELQLNAEGRFILSDLNSDGRLDLISSGPNGIHYWPGQASSPAGLFGAPQGIAESIANVQRFLSFDAQRDGRLDVWAQNGPLIEVYGVNLQGQPQRTPRADSWVEGATTLRYGDLNADTYDDLVLLSPLGVHTQAQQADGSYLSTDADLTGVPAGSWQVLEVIDLDGDGDLDLLLGGADGLTVLLSNRRETQQQRFARLSISRGAASAVGPLDAHGAVLYQDPTGGANRLRALPAHPTAVTAVSLGAGQFTSYFEIIFSRISQQGLNIQEFGGVGDDDLREIYAQP